MTLYQKKFGCLMLFGALSIFNLNHSLANENSDEGIKEKMEETAKDVKRGTKKGVRKIQDKSCEVVNGKTKCWPKKVKHSVQNEMDKVKDAAD